MSKIVALINTPFTFFNITLLILALIVQQTAYFNLKNILDNNEQKYQKLLNNLFFSFDEPI